MHDVNQVNCHYNETLVKCRDSYLICINYGLLAFYNIILTNI